MPQMPSRQSLSKGDRLLALGVEALVEHVEHLEEGHVLGDVVDLVGVHGSVAGRVGLAPDLQGESHYL
jgi:hypothetical protein